MAVDVQSAKHVASAGIKIDCKNRGHNQYGYCGRGYRSNGCTVVAVQLLCSPVTIWTDFICTRYVGRCVAVSMLS